MLDLLLDPIFFQMDLSCLPFWKQILDSLMTYDNTTFRELMGRVSLTQTGGLNIFVSRDQEYEQRAILLKRLAFVIFCSELDQYHKYMPEIQGRARCTESIPFSETHPTLVFAFRTIGEQLATAFGGAICSGGRVPLFPRAALANVSGSRDFTVAHDHR